jgi:hypothetical protein
MASYITLEEAKDHCRVDFDDDDVYILALMDVAETAILNEVKGQYPGTGTVTTAGTTTLEGDSDTIFIDECKAGDTIIVSGETSRVIASITDLNTLITTVAFTTSDSGLSYVIQPTPLESSVLPKPLKQAILLLIGNLYNQREPINVGNMVTKIPYSLDFLIAPYKTWVVK